MTSVPSKPFRHVYPPGLTQQEKNRYRARINRKKALEAETPDQYAERLRKQTEYYREHQDERVEYARQARASDPQKYRDRCRTYYAENSDKWEEYRQRYDSYKTGGEVFTSALVLEVYGSTCHLCGEPVDLEAPRRSGVKGWEYGLHIDHVIPLSKRGPDSLANVRPSHGICNLRKRDRLLSS